MTDLSLSQPTHLAPSVDSIIEPAPVLRFLQNSIPDGSTAEEDEDYTIKCICDFQEDDGNTVYCERCETWQHIVCYYGQKEVPELHNCADCEPRSVDARRATERQRRKREQPDIGDRKVKKSASKSHKKKTKLADQQPISVNGWSHDRNETISPRSGTHGSPKDHPLAKRPKTSHRSSHSIHSQVVPLPPPSHFSKRSGSASHTIHSPSKTPRNGTPNGYHCEPYSLDFLQLYESDPGDAPMQANLFNDIAITTCLSSWSHDVEELQEAANGKSPQDVFQRCNQPLDSMSFPQINKMYKEDKNIDYDGLHPRWTYLTIDAPTPKNTIVAELRGKIGHLQDYVQDPANRWDYLRHPLPFVFFHDQLPIYIDTRREGSTCRYLRRSCRPNLNMKTFLENGSEYHFCFVANQDLEKDVELTTGWRLDEHISNFVQHNDAGIKQEVNAETAGSYVADWVAKVLADFGGCACDSPRECRMASYHRRNSAVTGDSHFLNLFNGQSKKIQQGISHSSHSTGHATNSRSSSEALKPHDGDEQDDGRSTSGSLKSKPRSRDMTPSNPVYTEKGTAAGMEISGREKRKIAAMEKNFEQLEQDKQFLAQKKKKRNSGGSSLSMPGASYLKQQGHSATVKTPSSQTALNGQFRHRQLDTHPSLDQHDIDPDVTRAPFGLTKFTGLQSTNLHSRIGYTNSPTTSSFTSYNYVDSFTQTDIDNDQETSSLRLNSLSTCKPFMSLKKRLLMRCHMQRVENEAERETLSIRESLALNLADVAALNSPHIPLLNPSLSNLGVEKQNNKAHSVSLPISSPDPIVEKPRPPDETIKILDTTIDNIASTPKDMPLVSPSNRPQPLKNDPQYANGQWSTDSQLQPTLTQYFSDPATSASVITENQTTLSSHVAQSPITRTPTTYPSLLTSSSSGMIQPSPAKKKLSLGDYLSRRSSHKVDTLSTIVTDKLHSSSSPPMQYKKITISPNLLDESKFQQTDDNATLNVTRAEDDGLLPNKSSSQELDEL